MIKFLILLSFYDNHFMIIGIKVVSLQKISCTRQFVSKLTLRSFAFSLQKISCTRQFVSKLTLRSFAFSLQPLNI